MMLQNASNKKPAFLITRRTGLFRKTGILYIVNYSERATILQHFLT